jgi:ferredoxin
MKYKVNKEKCIGCQICIQNCPGATRIGEDGKAEIVDQKKLEECGGEKVCPFGAIEKISEEKNK